MIPKGTVWPWPSLAQIPDGWAKADGMRYMVWRTTTIVATRDHEAPPRVPDDVADALAGYRFR